MWMSMPGYLFSFTGGVLVPPNSRRDELTAFLESWVLISAGKSLNSSSRRAEQRSRTLGKIPTSLSLQSLAITPSSLRHTVSNLSEEPLAHSMPALLSTT